MYVSFCDVTQVVVAPAIMIALGLPQAARSLYMINVVSAAIDVDCRSGWVVYCTNFETCCLFFKFEL